MAVEVTVETLMVSMAVFVVVQGFGMVKAAKYGDFLYYYIPITIVAAMSFWASIVFFPVIAP
jgi:hypothetical protein